MSEAVILALVAIVGAVITALFKLLADNTSALKSLVDETKDGNDKAEIRNGHLGEQNVQITNLIIGQNKELTAVKTATEKTANILSKSALIAAEDREILTSANQIVQEQVVEHQTVKNVK